MKNFIFIFLFTPLISFASFPIKLDFPSSDTIIKNGKIYTPPIETGALGGITRKTVIEIANNLGLETEETNINADQLKDADELFFTGTATEVVGVVSVDGEDITDGKPGEITGNIRQKYLEIVNGENEDFLHYLTLVK